MNHVDHFRSAIEAAGLVAPDTIHDDGALHRFPTNGRRGDASGWYLLHTDGIPAGTFGCWRAGLHSTWCAKADSAMTAAEREAHRERIKAMRAQREAAESARQQEEADKAIDRWHSGSTHCQHPYLARKGVQAHRIRQHGDVLLIPLRDTAGTLHSLQTITPDGDKRFRGRMRGCYHAIGGKPLGRIVVCEGYATGASIHEATGEAVAVAFNAGNLMPVATALHRAHPDLVLLLAADDDHLTPGNPGMSAARNAAMAVGGFVVVPRFPPGRPDKATDFNDLAALAGPGAVRACFTEILEAVCQP
jgi:putative DNA primase/helicase